MRFLLPLLCMLPCLGFAQSELPPVRIQLENSSFEGEPADATMPAGWHRCDENSTPDILPGFWGVLQEAYDGDTFVGLITRPDGSKESLAQRLSSPLLPKECYRLSLELARSANYVDYNQPIQLRVWGGETRCDRAQLIYESARIEHEEWRNYTIDWYPKVRTNYLIIEVFHGDDARARRMGNVLIDDISVIVRCPRA